MRAKGLLDFLVVAVVCTSVYTQTPAGALVDRGVRWALGLPPPERPLTSFFTGGSARSPSPTIEDVETVARARNEDAPELARRAEQHKLPYALLRALDLASGPEGVALDPEQLSRARAVSGWSGGDTRDDRITMAGAAIEQYRHRFGAYDAALAALVVDPDAVERAVARATARGEASPGELHAHLDFYTRHQAERVQPFVNQVMAVKTALEFTWPLTVPHRMTSGFGWRVHPVLGSRSFHNGVDLAVPIGTKVLSAHAGQVLYSLYDGTNGNYTKIDHGYGLSTAYCHNSAMQVQRGEHVPRGHVVALSGNTGRSTGPHVHYLIKIGDTAIDPLSFGAPVEIAHVQ